LSKSWKNKIIGHDEVPPEQLLAHPENWRIHPKFQQEALRGVINDIGFIKSVTVNQRTGRVIDGHLRVTLALRDSVPFIPVEYVDLTEAEEAEALLTLDPIAALAGNDKDNLESLLAMVKTEDSGVMDLLNKLSDKVETLSEVDAFGNLPNQDRAPFQKMTFTLHDEQVDVIKEAMTLAKSAGAFVDSPNENSNGNALARICETYITNGNS
jgi:ParB-like chromosome segregation protein Spo0J